MTPVKEKIKNLIPLISAILSASYIIYFIFNPHWLNPVELLIVSIFIFASFGQAKELVFRLSPFVATIMIYEAFRGIADQLNTRVSYQWMIDVDEWLFGIVPTLQLQEWFWRGSPHWWDALLYFIYMLHFVVPWVLAILIWKKRETFYWRYISSFIFLSYLGFLTFLAVPAAPPWLAAQKGYIAHDLPDIIGNVWHWVGLSNNYTGLRIGPNPVAAVPSLHAGYATLVLIYSLLIFKKSKYKYFAAGYFLSIFFGAMYLEQHYFIDLLIGAIYACLCVVVIHKIIWPKFIETKRLHKAVRRLPKSGRG